VTLEARPELVERPEPVVCAFDIETTKVCMCVCVCYGGDDDGGDVVMMVVVW